ncbi:hypothetical protein [Oceanirhabdus seepicola]|uniref:Uncharacterized protein n=1 Tax=Oceanirhabdus seepicola TaxID=2828781 RepID=A0A9J6P6L6_9CLOT|nr:hypothetical protein [Oceanirhabdus seepicola]MCM1991144.1 hypothetical protein [Oceanirhabdus seepicola]
MPTDPNMETKPVKNVVTKENQPLHAGKKIESPPFEENMKTEQKTPKI